MVNQINKEKIDFIRDNSFKMKTKDIASFLNVNEKTVRNYVKKIHGYKVDKYGDFYRIKKQMKPINIDDVTAAYIAGFIDGEGQISIHRSIHKTGYISFTPLFRVTNTNKEIIIWLTKILEIQRNFYEINKHNKNWKLIYDIGKQGFAVYPVLERIYPFLKVKKEQAELVMRFIKLRINQKFGTPYSEEQKEIHSLVMILNKKGRER